MTSNPAVQPSHQQSPGKYLVPMLAISGMLTLLNGSVLGPLMPDISKDLSVSYPVLGQITAATFFGAAIISLFAGPLGDQFGRKRLVVFGLLMITVGAAGSAFAPGFGWLFAIRLTGAISAGMMAGTAMAIAGTLFEGVERRKAIGTIAAGIAAGPIIGIPVLTFVASATSWRASMLVIAVLGLVLAALAQRIVPDDSTKDAGRISLHTIVGAYVPLYRDHNMVTLFGATLLRATGWVGLLVYLGAYWADRHDLAVRDIGWTAMILGSGYFIGTKLCGGRLVELNLRMLFGVSTFICGLSFGIAIAMLDQVAIAMAVLMVAAMSGGIGFVALSSLVSLETPAGQGTTMSLNSAMFQLGSALGGTTGGVLLATGGYELLGVGLMGFMMLAGLIVWHPAWLRLPTFARPAIGD